MPPSSHRNIVVIAVLIVVAIALAIFFYSNRAEAPAMVSDTSGVAVVDTETPEGDTQMLPGGGTTTSDTPSASTQSAPKPTVTTKPAVQTTTKSPVPTYGAVINYTDHGFEPRQVTIFVGQTVRFVNTSNSAMWVASDIHPLHTAYPIKSAADCAGSSFDECTSVANGAHWDFKFDAIGSWDFHNHLKATEGGTVFVNKRD